jgi:hypothetical protein
MQLENPVRWGGFAAILAGVLLVISELLSTYFDYLTTDPLAYGETIAPYDGSIGFLSPVLVQLGLMGLYAGQARVAGILGLVGFVLAFTGGQFLIPGASFVYPFREPYFWPWEFIEEMSVEFFGWQIAVAVILWLCFVLGWVLLGVAALKSHVYPRAAAALLIAGVLILFLPMPLGGIIFAIALVWLGYALFTGRGEEARHATSREVVT